MYCPICSEVKLMKVDRQGIEIDYCPNCRGVWLDRGELDKLIERSTAPGWQPQQPQQPQPPQQPHQQPGYQQPHQQPGYQQPYQQPHQPGYQQPHQPAGYQQPHQQPGYQQPYQQPHQPYIQPVYGHGKHYYGHRRKHKRHDSFLDEFFDFD